MFDWSFLKNQKFWLTLSAIVSAFAVLLWPDHKDFINLILPLFVSLIFAILGIDVVEGWVTRAYARADMMSDTEIETRVKMELNKYNLLPQQQNSKPSEVQKSSTL